MKNFVHIKSLIPANISINGEHQALNNLDVLSEKNFFITFYPNSEENYLPCSISFYGDILPESIKKIPYANNHYDLIYSPIIYPKKDIETIIMNKKYKNTIFTLKNTTMSYISISSIHSAHNSSTFLINNVDFKTFDNHVVIIGKCNKNKTYLLIYDTKNHTVLLENIFQKIEITKNEIKALKEEKSLVGYGKVYEFNINNKTLSSYSTYVSKHKDNIKDNELIVLAFLEGIKFEDYKTSLNYLQDNNVSIDYIKNYFGKIKEIYYNGYSKNINFTILSDCYHSYTFTLNNNKIVDIEENELDIV